MGKALSILNRQANRYNAEVRAHKVIGLEKPTPAPKHPSTIKHLKEALADQAGIEKIAKKDNILNERLKKVYVTSQTSIQNEYGKPSRNNLKRDLVEDTELGYVEPLQVAEGKVSLKQAMELLAQNQGDPEKFSASILSEKYKIDLKDTQDVLRYFSTFHLYMPPNQKELQGKGKLQIFKSFKSSLQLLSTDTKQKGSKQIESK